MFKKNTVRRILLIISFILLITSTVNTTFGFVISKTDTLINFFRPEDKITNGVSIIKTIEHSLGENYVIPDNIAFDFTLSFGSFYADTTLETSAGKMKTDEKGVLSVRVKPDVSFMVDDIDAGTIVRIKEIENSLEGFSAKEQTEKTVVVPQMGYAQAQFVNLYTPKSCTADNITVKGKKVLQGREFKEGDFFSFILEHKINGEWVKLDTQTVEYKKEKFTPEFQFSPAIKKLSFTNVGEYQFRMREEKGKLAGVDYDGTVNTFSVFVTDKDMDGKLEISDVKSAQNAVASRTQTGFSVNVVFNNTFKPEVAEDTYLNISVIKTVKNKGSYKRNPEGFEFILQNTQSGEKYTFKTDANGDGKTQIIITKDDIDKTLIYNLYENKGDEKGVSYDQTVYEVVIKPYLTEDYKIAAACFVNGDEVGIVAPCFENVCDIDKPNVPATGSDKNIYFWMILAFLSGTSCIVILLTDREREEIKA